MHAESERFVTPSSDRSDRYDSRDAAFEIAALARLEALWDARARFDEMVREAVREICAHGVHRGRVADVLGVHRATLYRQFLSAVEREDAEGDGGQPFS